MSDLSVLLCTDYLPPSGGGVEHVVETLAERLDAAGVEVVVYALKTADDKPPLATHESITVVQSPAIDLTEIIGLQSAVSPRALYDFPELLKEFEPDIVHLHNRFFFTSAIGSFAREYADCPVVTTFHVGAIDEIDGFGGVLAGLFQNIVSRYVVSNSDHTVCVSKSVTEVARALGATDVSVIRNAVDIDKFRPSKTADDSLSLLYVGRLVRNNGPQDLVSALPAVLEANPDVTVDIVGKGHMEEQLREQVRTSGYSDRVTIHGYVDDLLMMYDRADVFCRPSYSEGLPLTLLESMASGVPPVVTPVAGVPEIVTDGENGRLVPCDNPEALANTLIELFSDPAERRQLAENARQTVEANHSWEQRCEQVRALYDSLLAERVG